MGNGKRVLEFGNYYKLRKTQKYYRKLIMKSL